MLIASVYVSLNVVSEHNIYANKSVDKMFFLSTSPFFLCQVSKSEQGLMIFTVPNLIQTLCQLHDLNIDFRSFDNESFVVRKRAKIRNRYIQVPHLTQDTNGKVTNSQLITIRYHKREPKYRNSHRAS